jgi:hypothetical protein
MRFRSPSRHRPIESTCGGFRHHPRSALSVPPTHSGFLLDVLFGFVSPQSRVQDSPSRGFPRQPASTTLRCFFPSSRFAKPAYIPQGNAPALKAARTRSCSSWRSVTPISGFSADAVRSPLRIFTSPGLFSASHDRASNTSSAHALLSDTSQ